MLIFHLTDDADALEFKFANAESASGDTRCLMLNNLTDTRSFILNSLNIPETELSESQLDLSCTSIQIYPVPRQRYVLPELTETKSSKLNIRIVIHNIRIPY